MKFNLRNFLPKYGIFLLVQADLYLYPDITDQLLLSTYKPSKLYSKYTNNQKMNFNIYDVFYSQCSHQHVPAGIPAIFSVILLQEYKHTNVVNGVTIIP